MASALQTLTDIVPALGDEDVEVRLAAIRKLEPQVLTEHADTIIPLLLGAGYIAALFKVILIGTASFAPAVRQALLRRGLSTRGSRRSSTSPPLPSVS